MAQRRQQPAPKARDDGALVPVLPLAGAAVLLRGPGHGPLWFVGLVLAVVGLGLTAVVVQELRRALEGRWRMGLPVLLSVLVVVVLVGSL